VPSQRTSGFGAGGAFLGAARDLRVSHFARVKPLDYALPLAIIAFHLVRYWNQTLVA
jgi:hypothetical protein